MKRFSQIAKSFNYGLNNEQESLLKRSAPELRREKQAHFGKQTSIHRNC